MRPHLLATTLLLLLAPHASAYIFMPATVDDALQHAHRWIAAHPNRPEGYFFLARVNASAWAKGTTPAQNKSKYDTAIPVATFGNADQPPRFVPWESLMFQRDPSRPITPQSRQYLADSLAAYQKTVALDPQNPLYHLGLAWALEQAANAHLQPTPTPPPAPLTPEELQQCKGALDQLANTDFAARNRATHTLAALMPRDAELLLSQKPAAPETQSRLDNILKHYWLTQAADHYRQAYHLSVEKDLHADHYDAEADATISVKAGERLLLILPSANPSPDPFADPSTAPEAATIQSTLTTIKAKPTLGHAY